MFRFILGFIIGGVTGAAIVLALSPSYQYQEGSTDGAGEPASGLRGRAGELGEQVQAKVKEAVEEGKKAAAERTAELEEIARGHRRPRGESEEAEA